ncbi:tryptophan halogenase family protein [Polaromonas sp.]|uniref:tryptophan halogenase family protein n=1 Tax=Polaromonas sp. TaxID=1869339 RepID=UPI0032638F2C
MVDLSAVSRVVVVGGGTAGWLSALEMRHTFATSVEVVLVESEAIGILGAGEGTVPNILSALQRYGIEQDKFMTATQATFKLGVEFEGWREARHIYHHLFSFHNESVDLASWRTNGAYPFMSALVAAGVPLGEFPASAQWIRDQASQAEVKERLGASELEGFAYHFDAPLVAKFLRAHAESQGVRRHNATVADVELDSSGSLTAVLTDKGRIEGDFFVDATGMARLILLKKLGIPWKSFSDYLILDSALPFLLPHNQPHPQLVTRSVALDAGWMWVIPTGGRLGCGYVYSSKHVSREQALAEVSTYWGTDVEPINHIKFSPGRLEQCWFKNVMAVGLSSGFVEPLEATSIGQTIDQLMSFGDLMQEGQYRVTDHMRDVFNQKVASYWDGILDFLVLHYDTARSDTQFWKDVQALPRPAQYIELKRLFQTRLPREVDLLPYELFGKHLFGLASWVSVGAPMGIMPANTADKDLIGLSKEELDKLSRFVATVRPPAHEPSRKDLAPVA